MEEVGRGVDTPGIVREATPRVEVVRRDAEGVVEVEVVEEMLDLRVLILAPALTLELLGILGMLVAVSSSASVYPRLNPAPAPTATAAEVEVEALLLLISASAAAR